MTTPGRTALTSHGTHADAFRLLDWTMLGGIALIWGSSFVFMAIGLDAFEPGVVTLARLVLGAGALALMPAARRPIDRLDRARVAVLGVIWMAIPLSLIPIAQQWIDSSVAGMINGAVPITAALWATLLMRRLPPRRQLVGIAIGFIGMVLIFLPELSDSSATALGTGLIVIAVIAYGLSNNMAVPLQQRYGAAPVLLRAQLVAMLVVAPIAILKLRDSSWAWDSALAMLPLGILGTGLALVLMTNLVGRVGSTRGSVAIYFVPVVAIILGVIVRDEKIHGIALVGMALILIGAWVTSRKESRAVSGQPDALQPQPVAGNR